MTWHEVERAALATALLAAGPDAPTLCEGWQSRHLAAHVVLRERSPLVAAGIALPMLARRTEQAIEQLAETATDRAGFTDLVAEVSAGPPGWNPMWWAGESANLLEFFVHTEDVRRGAAQVEPLELESAHVDALWRHLLRRARLMYRRAPVGVVLVVPSGPRRVVRRARADAGTVVVRGDVGEIVLHAHGRGAAARVHVLGDAADVEALERALAG